MSNGEREKLKILLNHWIKHNKEHSKEFREWAEKAKRLGEAEPCDDIMGAAQELDKANEFLVRALKRFEGKGS